MGGELFGLGRGLLRLAGDLVRIGDAEASCEREGEGGGEAAEGGSGIAESITYAQSADPRALDPAVFDDGESAKVAANILE